MWLPKAIQCFLNQTYPHRELLIVSDGEDVKDLVSRSLEDAYASPLNSDISVTHLSCVRAHSISIRLIHTSHCPEIGAKRNFGCEQAAGEIVCHWDDDDWSGPGRIADQVERLLSTGKSVTGYHSIRFTDGVRSWMYRGVPRGLYAVGTSLCYRRDWWMENRFQAIPKGEDNQFCDRARERGVIVSVDAGDLMYATVHSENTSPRELVGDNWRLIA